ncbi:MAG TPA: TonB family protein [Bryobacteraceae bacterium]
MTAQFNILDQPEPMRKAFLVALSLHLGLIGAMGVSKLIHYDTLGDKNPGGAAVGIEIVDKIPLPHEGQKNPLANDTESQVQQAPPKPEAIKKEVAPPDAIPLKSKKPKKTAPDESVKQKFRPYSEVDPYKVQNKTAPQVSSEMFSAAPGAGNIGAGPRTALGDEFGGYAAQIRDIIARNWRTGDLDPRLQTAPRVSATFDLMRDGSIRNLTLLQSSGNAALDNSARRAILDSQFPILPPNYRHDRAPMEIWFELKR